MRQCSLCRLCKDVGQFHKNKNTCDGLSSRCKECAREVSRKWSENNRVQHRERSKAWQLANPEKRREIANRYARKQPLEESRKTQKGRRDGLCDTYVKQLIARESDISFTQIPSDLVEAKRLTIQIHRLLKEKKDAEHS